MDEGQSDLSAVERCCRCGEGLLQFLRQTSTRNIHHHDVQGDLYDTSKEVSVPPLRNVAYLCWTSGRTHRERSVFHQKMPQLDDTENVQCSTGNQLPHYSKQGKLQRTFSVSLGTYPITTTGSAVEHTQNVQCSTGSLPRQDKQGLLLNTHRTFSIPLGAYPVKINKVCC